MSWDIFVAYGVGLFFVGAVGSAIGSLVGFGVFIYRHPIWSWAAGFCVAILVYLIGQTLFQWLGVKFAWYSYLLCMVRVIYNDGQRIALDATEFGPEKRHAFGTTCGIVASLIFL